MVKKYSHCGYRIPSQMKICWRGYEHDGDHEFVADESLEGRAVYHVINLDRLLTGRDKYPETK